MQKENTDSMQSCSITLRKGLNKGYTVIKESLEPTLPLSSGFKPVPAGAVIAVLALTMQCRWPIPAMSQLCNTLSIIIKLQGWAIQMTHG
jgi:hypothetical protein